LHRPVRGRSAAAVPPSDLEYLPRSGPEPALPGAVQASVQQTGTMLPGLDSLWLVLAGFGAGLIGSVAGLASLVSYPALLAVGIPPVAANVSNTVALVFSGAGSVWGSRPELAGQRARAWSLAALAVPGGLVGGTLLLATPAATFALVVPWLIGLAAIAILLRREPVPAAQTPPREQSRRSRAAVFSVAVYCGYFGAGAGVLLLALLLATTGEPLARCNALKNLLLGVANAVAAVAFVAFGPVHWAAAAPLAVGFLCGGRLGPVIVRRAPVGPLRVLIALGGLGLALHLGFDAYH